MNQLVSYSFEYAGQFIFQNHEFAINKRILNIKILFFTSLIKSSINYPFDLVPVICFLLSGNLFKSVTMPTTNFVS